MPSVIFDRWPRLPKPWRWNQIDGRWMYFDSEADALVTLSDLCVSFGRKAAKLKPLRNDR